MEQFVARVNVEYISGHLRHGHYMTTFTAKEKEEFDALPTLQEQAEFIGDRGELYVDDFEVNDRGDLELDSICVE